MHIHNVYFWLKNDLEQVAVSGFEQGLAALTRDPAVKTGYFGRPANTHRDVVDNSYSYSLVLLFDNLAAHDRYQTGAVHLEFVHNHSPKWARVVVYDVETR